MDYGGTGSLLKINTPSAQQSLLVASSGLSLILTPRWISSRWEATNREARMYSGLEKGVSRSLFIQKRALTALRPSERK